MKIPLSYWKRALFLIVFLIVLIASWEDAFYSYELPLLDLRFRLRHPARELAPLAIIEIDNSTLESLGSWPIKRNFYALLLKALTDVGVRAVVFDIFFSESSPYDLYFAEAIKNNGRVYLPLGFKIEEPQGAIAYSREIIAKERNNFLSLALGIGHINLMLIKMEK